MTRSEAIKKVTDLAVSQVGYKEGENNWNKYAADPMMTQAYGWSLQNQPWCGVFMNWLFVDTFGLPTGKNMTYGCSASCAQQAAMYKNAGAYGIDPHVGDQIFILINGTENHTGIVVGIDGDRIATVEGNWSDMVSMVYRKTTDGDIGGFGTPDWNLVSEDPVDEKTGLVVDGECGKNTWAAIAKRMPDVTKLPLVKKGSKGWAVEFLQVMLNYFGADLDADGDFGVLTEKEVREFQEGRL